MVHGLVVRASQRQTDLSSDDHHVTCRGVLLSDRVTVRAEKS
jgi:hypothetical protein